jgi:hypothetical protein
VPTSSNLARRPSRHNISGRAGASQHRVDPNVHLVEEPVLEERRCSRPKPYVRTSPPGWCLILLIWLATSPLTTLEFVQRRGEGYRGDELVDAVEAVGDRAALARAGPARTSYVARTRMIASAVASCSAIWSAARRRCSRSATPL